MILVISPYLDKTYAGWAKQTKKLFKSFYFDDFEIQYIVLNQEIISGFDKKNIKINTINLNDINSFKNKIYFVINILFFLIKNRKKITYVYLPNLYWYSLIFVFLNKLFSINFIGRICANEIKFLNKYSIIKLFLLKSLKKIIVLNKSTLFKLNNHKFENTIYIPNPVDSDFFKFSNSYKNISLLFVGEINPRKGVKELIINFIKLKNNFSNIKLDLVGPVTDIYYHRDLLLLIKDYQNSISFVPQLDEKSLFNKYHESDIFILPSYSEGMPNVILEAMSCGNIVVGSEIPGIVENITHNSNGFLFSHQKNDLYKVLYEILNNKYNIHMIKSNARKFIENERSNIIIYKTIKDLFK